VEGRPSLVRSCGQRLSLVVRFSWEWLCGHFGVLSVWHNRPDVTFLKAQRIEILILPWNRGTFDTVKSFLEVTY